MLAAPGAPQEEDAGKAGGKGKGKGGKGEEAPPPAPTPDCRFPVVLPSLPGEKEEGEEEEKGRAEFPATLQLFTEALACLTQFGNSGKPGHFLWQNIWPKYPTGRPRVNPG